MKRRRAEGDEEHERVHRARMLRSWRSWHDEERKTVLAGPHGAMVERLLYILKDLTLKSSKLLLAYVRGIDWAAVDYDTRLTILHEIGTGITALREKNGLTPFDDDMSGERPNVFLTLKDHLFPPDDGGAKPGEAGPTHPSPEHEDNRYDDKSKGIYGADTTVR